MVPSVPREQENSERKKNPEYNSAGVNDGSSSDDEDEEFEFSFVPQGGDEDDLFGDGERHPVYPLFDQSLLRDGDGEVVELTSSFQGLSVEEGEKREISGHDELGLPADGYCVWAPKMGAPPLDASNKSRSTGTSSSRKWKLMDLMVGRSRSDGKEKFLFLAPPSAAPAERKNAVMKKPAKEMDMKTAHERYYGKGGAGDRRPSSHLHYRKGLAGFRV